jgi:hypothetical protein
MDKITDPAKLNTLRELDALLPREIRGQSQVLPRIADACNDLIIVRLKNHTQIVHEILEPFRITLHHADGIGNFNPLQIAAENGMSILTLHPAIHAQMLV